MRLGPKVLTLIAIAAAAILSLAAAWVAADVIEERSRHAVKTALLSAGHDWAEVHADGLQVHLGGEAPTEATRFNAMSVSGQVVDAARVIDGITITPSEPLAPPKFSAEILRNEDGVSVIGLVPAAMDVEVLTEEIRRATKGSEVTSFLETADYPVPGGWVEAMEVGIDALGRMPRSKISIAAGLVIVNAISDSANQKRALESVMTRRVPDTVRLSLDISAPRPVLTPFPLRFLIEDGIARFDACAVDDDESEARIISAARAAGLEGEITCTHALGVPSSEWADAVVMTIDAVAELGGGTVTFSDADVTLRGTEDISQTEFDKVVGELESNLPDVFSLSSVLPEPVVAVEGEPAKPEFSATRSPEGQVQLRGRLPNQVVHSTVESFAQARFGVENVYMAARLDTNLPEDWPVWVLAGLRALSELDRGVVTVLEDRVAVRGVTGNKEASTEIASILTEKLGDAAVYDLKVDYDAALDPLTGLPTPAQCIGKIKALQGVTKITFGPGSTAVEGDSAGIVDRIAQVLKDCREVEMSIEIAGHTDSQGRETMNLELSEKRAGAVLEALQARRVLTGNITARGYGETTPIADNSTEDGREANRRIEFNLLTGVDAAENAAGEPPAEEETQ